MLRIMVTNETGIFMIAHPTSPIPTCMKLVRIEMWHSTLSVASVDSVVGSSGASSHVSLNGSVQVFVTFALNGEGR